MKKPPTLENTGGLGVVVNRLFNNRVFRLPFDNERYCDGACVSREAYKKDLIKP